MSEESTTVTSSSLGRVSVRFFSRTDSGSSSAHLTGPSNVNLNDEGSFVTLGSLSAHHDLENDTVESASEVDEESLSKISDNSRQDSTHKKTETKKKSDSNEASSKKSTSPSEERENNSVKRRRPHLNDAQISKQIDGMQLDMAPMPRPAATTFSPELTTLRFLQDAVRRYKLMPFSQLRLYAIAFLIAMLFILPAFLSGLLIGFYLSFIAFLFFCVSEPILETGQDVELNERVFALVSNETKDENKHVIYKGWMNILNHHYDPHSFHVNTAQTVLVRLDKNLLRISRPERNMTKHTFHVDPTLNEPEPRMQSQNIYDLTNATVRLRPRRLARRRWFSRKYPICIILAECDAGSGKVIAKELKGPNDPVVLSVPDLRYNGSEERSENDGETIDSTSKKSKSRKRKKGNAAPKFIVDGSTDETELSEEECADDEETELSVSLPSTSSSLRHSISDCNVSSKASNGTKSLGRATKNRKTKRCIFLFARSQREKERWFHILVKTCHKYKSFGGIEDVDFRNRRLSLPTAEQNLADRYSREFILYILHEVQFKKQLDKFLEGTDYRVMKDPNECVVNMDLGKNKWNRVANETSEEFIVLVNLLATRIFYDFCRDKYWCGLVRNRFQNKLSTLHLPYFVEELELSKFDLGTAAPRILKVYPPMVDEWGIWVDLEIKYTGMIKLTLETKVNLMKLKKVSEAPSAATESPTTDDPGQFPFHSSALRTTPSRYSDSDIPESPETSPDEDFGSKMKENDQPSTKVKTKKKILSFVDKIAHSKYFREASELKPIRKMMEEISSTRLILKVEVTAVEGTVTINLAPPPSDRLWYGFRKPPQMAIKALPQVNERTVVLSTLSDWIENKISQLVERNLVVPNMDDVIIPMLSGNELIQGPINR